jgi:GGDEF domain-containing protein
MARNRPDRPIRDQDIEAAHRRTSLNRPDGSGPVKVGASIGVALVPAGESVEPSDLLRHADMAMYEVKRPARTVGGWRHPGPRPVFAA